MRRLSVIALGLLLHAGAALAQGVLLNGAPIQGTALQPSYVVEPPNTPVLKNSLSNTASQVIGSAARLEVYYCVNPNTSDAFVQIFDAPSPASVVVGTTTPRWSIRVIGTANGSGGGNMAKMDLGFFTGIQVAATTTATGSSA